MIKIPRSLPFQNRFVSDSLGIRRTKMESYKREFIQFLQNAGVLKFGDFTAKSG